MNLQQLIAPLIETQNDPRQSRLPPLPLNCPGVFNHQPQFGVKEPPRGVLVFNYQQPTESNPELEGDLLKEEDQDRPMYPGLQGHIGDPKDCITATDAVHNIGSGQAVRMFHIGFVRPPTSSSDVTALPQLSVMLPLSASGSQAHSLPSAVGRGIVAGRGIMLLGGYGACCQRVQLRHQSLGVRRGMGDVVNKELLEYACPAAGFFVDEKKDLGEWTAFSGEGEGDEVGVGVTETGSGSERFRDGKLIRKMEMFNWQDDIDLEGICNWCNSPAFLKQDSRKDNGQVCLRQGRLAAEQLSRSPTDADAASARIFGPPGRFIVFWCHSNPQSHPGQDGTVNAKMRLAPENASAPFNASSLWYYFAPFIRPEEDRIKPMNEAE
ncbi:hypothetical protein BKA56DRAFT_711347 [Ilyonectria sp. MPI-CAGE-AT-0026]|nr:hypothetical protein BKA56DRAFT_711347 [Ilyonectria sp. MPI-CAGE-AT-0026]